MSADFPNYLQSLCDTYQHWWSLYTITDVEGSKTAQRQEMPSLFDFGLMVETVQAKQQERGETPEKIERLPVQEGLRKYAENHVLLVGRPGSGKSTALARLLLEEAQKARSPLNPPLERGEEELESKPPLERREEELQSKPPFSRQGCFIPQGQEVCQYHEREI
jgi:predicted NACHT family NTPase